MEDINPAEKTCAFDRCRAKFRPRGVGTSREQICCSRICMTYYNNAHRRIDYHYMRSWFRHYAEYHCSTFVPFEEMTLEELVKLKEHGGLIKQRIPKEKMQIPDIKKPGEMRWVWREPKGAVAKTTIGVCDVVVPILEREEPNTLAFYREEAERGKEIERLGGTAPVSILDPGSHEILITGLGRMHDKRCQREYVSGGSDSNGGRLSAFYYNTLRALPSVRRHEGREARILRELTEQLRKGGYL